MALSRPVHRFESGRERHKINTLRAYRVTPSWPYGTYTVTRPAAVILSIQRLGCRWSGARILRKVRLTLGPQGLLSLSIPCFQFFWVSPFITNKLPDSSGSLTVFRSCLVLCFRINVRRSPRLSEAIVGCAPSSFHRRCASPCCHFGRGSN